MADAKTELTETQDAFDMGTEEVAAEPSAVDAPVTTPSPVSPSSSGNLNTTVALHLASLDRETVSETQKMKPVTESDLTQYRKKSIEQRQAPRIRTEEPKADLESPSSVNDVTERGIGGRMPVILGVSVIAAALVCGAVAVLSWMNTNGGGTGEPVGVTSTPVPADDTDSTVAAAATAKSVTSAMLSFDERASLELKSGAKSLTWNPDEKKGNGNLMGGEPSTEYEVVTMPIDASDGLSVMDIKLDEAKGAFVSLYCAMDTTGSDTITASYVITNCPDKGTLHVDPIAMTVTYEGDKPSLIADGAMPEVGINVTQNTADGAYETAEVGVVMGDGSKDVTLTANTREITLRSVSGLGKSPLLRGSRHSVTSNGQTTSKPDTGGAVILDDDAHEYVANYDELAEEGNRQAQENKTKTVVPEGALGEGTVPAGIASDEEAAEADTSKHSEDNKEEDSTEIVASSESSEKESKDKPKKHHTKG